MYLDKLTFYWKAIIFRVITLIRICYGIFIWVKVKFSLNIPTFFLSSETFLKDKIVTELHISKQINYRIDLGRIRNTIRYILDENSELPKLNIIVLVFFFS